jgi:uncharacterized protein (DUF2062 family)
VSTEPRADRSSRLHRSLAWLFRLRGSPEAVARGLAIGVFISFTPSIGMQTVSALFLATLLGANRPASVAGSLLTNPFTQAPTSAFAYWVGTFFWSGPPLERVRRVIAHALESFSQRSLWELGDPLREFAALSRDVFMPLWIGGIVLGLLGGGVVYAAVLPLLRGARRRWGHHGPPPPR